MVRAVGVTNKAQTLIQIKTASDIGASPARQSLAQERTAHEFCMRFERQTKQVNTSRKTKKIGISSIENLEAFVLH